MLVKISLIVAMCSNTSLVSIQKKVAELETRNPGSKVSFRIDKKLKCDANGNPISKVKSLKAATHE